MICYWNNCNEDVEEMISHLKKHIEKEDGMDCKWINCNASKPSKFKMMQHLMKHASIPIFSCQCGKSFRKKAAQVAHVRTCQVAFNSIVEDLFSGLPLTL